MDFQNSRHTTQISIMPPSTMILFGCGLLCLGIDASNLEYAFHDNDFNFLSWRNSDDGFECHRDQHYLVTCKSRWTHILRDLDYCNTQCASGGRAIFNAIIAIESITIAVLLLYIYRKPKIDEKERKDILKYTNLISKHSSNQ